MKNVNVSCLRCTYLNTVNSVGLHKKISFKESLTQMLKDNSTHKKDITANWSTATLKEIWRDVSSKFL